jgi:hypothetical protein
MFIYSEGQGEKLTFFTPYHKMNATQGYLNHYANFMYLRFIRDNPNSSTADKRQASREIVICDRKLNWWLRHPNLEHAAVSAGKRKLHEQWRMK